jgi:hypothetical protein
MYSREEEQMAGKKIFNAFLSLGLCLGLTLPLGAAAAPDEMKKPSANAGSTGTAKKTITAIRVSFKVAAITPQSFYMGEVWTPTIKEAQAGDRITVGAKAVGLDSLGNQVDITPTWKAGNPAMINITPDQGPKVKLTALKTGQSHVTVAFGGISKKFPLKVWQDEDKIMHLEITQ